MPSSLDIEWHGADGTVWHVCGSEVEAENVLLLPNIGDMFDTPVTTQWIKGPFSENYQGFRVQRRNPVLGFRIFGSSPDEWRQIDAEFRKSWDYDREGFMRLITDDGYRDLFIRLAVQPEAYGGDANLGGGYDPHWLSDAQVVINGACENPFYVGQTVRVDHEIVSSGSGSHTFSVRNDGDAPVWLRWTITCQTNGLRVTLPDYSFGNDRYGRAVADADREILVCPAKGDSLPDGGLLAGEHVTLDSAPDEPLIVSDIDTNPWARMRGNTLLYEVPPNTPPTDIDVSWLDATAGDEIRLSYTPMYTRPWG